MAGSCPRQYLAPYFGMSNTKIIHFIQNPGLITNKLLKESKLNANYCSALHQSLISIKNGILIYRETIVGSKSYTQLQLVPSKFCNIIFVAFHANPLVLILTLITPSIVFASNFIGRACIRTSHECAVRALDVRWPTRINPNQVNWFASFQLRHQ